MVQTAGFPLKTNERDNGINRLCNYMLCFSVKSCMLCLGAYKLGKAAKKLRLGSNKLKLNSDMKDFLQRTRNSCLCITCSKASIEEN
jgi:hypothetical protein